ncbi:MAG: N-acetylmuramoyl-L-alanine amidase [Firmicutes bacterium]|nr:N-acetylmuramoyl-L-alanine amidase [Bacillota bacterium]
MDAFLRGPVTVTNIRHAVRSGAVGPAGLSVLVVEATSPPCYLLGTEKGGRRVLLHLPGARIRFPAGLLPVHAGLLETVTIKEEKDRLILELSLVHPTRLNLCRTDGLPALLRVEMNREPLYRIMRGRRILLDPAHGGEEAGGKGPVDLREKDKVFALALLLRRLLVELGATVYLTREADRNPPLSVRRTLVHQLQPEAVILLHLGRFAEAARGGFRTAWANEEGRSLAATIHDALTRTLPLPDRGWGMGPPWGIRGIPVVVVEVATITNPVEEGWLRSGTFLRRAARAIANGLKDYLARGEGRETTAASISFPGGQ